VNRISLSISEEGYIERALDFIKAYLIEKKVSKANIIRTQLLSEESIVLLEKHAPKGSTLKVGVRKLLGDVSIELTMDGDSFEPDISIADSLGKEAVDDASEDAIRAILMKAFGEKYKYNHKNNVNKVRIIAEKAGKSAILTTLIAMALGLVFGVLMSVIFPPVFSETICSFVLRPIKTIFMNSLSIIITPVIFFSLVSCFSQFKNLSDLGRVAFKIMMVYLITTLVATMLGFVVTGIVSPGEWGFALGKDVSSMGAVSENEQMNYSLYNTLISIVPDNIVAPFLEGNTLQVMFLAILVGTCVGMIGEYSAVLTEIFEACNSLFMTITTMITKAIPVVVFCSIALMVKDIGWGSILMVTEGLITQISAIFLMICFYGLMVLVVCHLNPIKFYKNIREGMLTSMSLCSSSAAMPVNMRVCTEKLGIPPVISNFSIPLGASVNMDGTCIYLASMILFLAKAYAVSIEPSNVAPLALTIILLSLGAPGIPGNALVCLSVALVQAGIPIEAVGLVIAINPIADMFDTMNNTTGDMAAALVVASREKMLDIDKFNAD